MSTQTGTGIETRLFVGGEWVDAEGGRTFEDRDPFTRRRRRARAPRARREDAPRAVEAAAAAFPEWSQTPPAMRQGIFLKAADVLESRQRRGRRDAGAGDRLHVRLRHVPDELRAGAAAPGGGARVRAARRDDPLGHRRVRDGHPAAGRRRRRDRAVERGADPVGALDRRAARARQHGGAEAVGVVAVVGGLLWGEIFAEAGLPAGVLNIVTHAPGEAAPIGDELVENPAVRRINFTGSTATGRKLAEAAGRQLKRVVLELGGYNPLIVLADADLDYAVNATAFGAFLHQGQICMSARRIIVERPIADEFTARLAEKTQRPQGRRPERARHDHRPADQRGRARRWCRSGSTGRSPPARRCSRAARRSGRASRRRSSPTCPADSEFANDETFGPVAAIEVVDSAEEAVARANATSYGLSSGIITSDTDRGLALAQQIDAGIVHVNDQPVGDEPQMPFGGVKDCGLRAASAARRSSTSSPSCAGSPCSAAPTRSRSEPSEEGIG